MPRTDRPSQAPRKAAHVDVLIVGAGISGIGAACHLSRECGGSSFLIPERRTAIGGTWDLFRYPGVRSDSDMFSFAYEFRPWQQNSILADGHQIRQYVQETAAEYGITEKIRFGRRVRSASWSTATGLWSLEVVDQASGATETYTANFLMGCTGYYNYDAGYRPPFPGEQAFAGEFVHPQKWPADLDYKGKRVVVIGSGATAITLIPAMAPDAEHVTMLQRSPTYIVTVPKIDRISGKLGKVMPKAVVYRLARLRNIALQRSFYQLTRTAPGLARKLVLAGVKRQIGDEIDMRHFTPTYNPWDQRLCVVPNGDLFKVLRKGEASIETGHIETFTKTGIRLKSGVEIEADIVVTATGLDMQMFGGVQVDVDGEPVKVHDRVVYKGVMLDGVPNAMMVVGYTNASWTLKADLASIYFCRLLNHMKSKKYSQVVALAQEGDRSDVSVLGSALTSGYVERGDAVMPRQGNRRPWKVLNDFVRDAPILRHAPINDDALDFS